MRLIRLFGCALVMTLSHSVLADASNVLLEFSSKGPDLYADGTPALKGEWYALVWSSDGKFGGLAPDCTPVREGDEVLVALQLATGGEKSHCPYVVFQMSSAKAKSTGTYSLLLLDTRNVEKTAVAAANAEKRPTEVNGAVETISYRVSTSSSGSGAKSAVAMAASEPVWSESVIVGAEEAAVKISTFEVKGDTVEISADNMKPGVKYNVRMGSEPGELKDYALEVPQTATKSTFIIKKDQANFFQVVRQPLDK